MNLTTVGNNIYRHNADGRKRSFICRARVSDIRPTTGDDKGATWMTLWFANNESLGLSPYANIWIGKVSTPYYGTFEVVGYSNVSGANIVDWYRI